MATVHIVGARTYVRACEYTACGAAAEIALKEGRRRVPINAHALGLFMHGWLYRLRRGVEFARSSSWPGICCLLLESDYSNAVVAVVFGRMTTNL